MSDSARREARHRFLLEWHRSHYGTAATYEGFEDRSDCEIMCEHGSDFDRWLTHTFAPVYRAPSAAKMSHAFQMLLHEFVARYRYMPASHRRKAPFRGHMCVFEVFRMEYDALKELEDANVLNGFAQPDTSRPKRPTRHEYFESMQ